MDLAPKRAGFDSGRLNRITEHLDRNYIEPAKIAGCQVLVARHGYPAYFRSFGLMDRERRRALSDDTIFRIYSMSKPITSVALMTLYERGHFQLNDPVSRFIPEWRDRKVWVSGEGAGMETAAPIRPMTMRHVLSHTGGLTYGATNHPVDRAYREAGVGVAIDRRQGDTLRDSPGSSPRFRCATIRANTGCTRSRPTCAGTWWKRFPASASISTCRKTSSIRWI